MIALQQIDALLPEQSRLGAGLDPFRDGGKAEPAGEPEQMAQHEAMMLTHIGKKLNLDANLAAKLKVLADLFMAQHTPPAAGTDFHESTRQEPSLWR